MLIPGASRETFPVAGRGVEAVPCSPVGVLTAIHARPGREPLAVVAFRPVLLNAKAGTSYHIVSYRNHIVRHDIDTGTDMI